MNVPVDSDREVINVPVDSDRGVMNLPVDSTCLMTVTGE